MATFSTAEGLGVDCPACNSAASGYELDAGVQITVPGGGPGGGPGTLLGAGDEVRWGSGEVKAAPDFNRVTLHPCGHTFRGFEGGNDLLQRIRQVVDERNAAAAAATLAQHGELLRVAEAIGHGAVVEKYRQAVRARSRTEQGLLVTLRVLTESRTTEIKNP